MEGLEWLAWWLWLPNVFAFLVVPSFALIVLLVAFGMSRAARAETRDEDAARWISRSDDWSPDDAVWQAIAESPEDRP